LLVSFRLTSKMGQRKTQGKQIKSGLGRALVKSRDLDKKVSTHIRQAEFANYHTTEVPDNSGPDLRSIMERNAIDEFLTTAMLSAEQFQATKGEQVLLTGPELVEKKQTRDHEIYEFESVKIPRRPAWTKEMGKEQVKEQEYSAYLEWRRDLAQLAESHYEAKKMTPFEKNIEVWKQLWRVVERSDVVVQIVDARNPLLFHSKDLKTYVLEHAAEKKCVLLVNKADYLSLHARNKWADYFDSQEIEYMFFSAIEAQSILDEQTPVLAEEKRKEKMRQLQTILLPEGSQTDTSSTLDTEGDDGAETEEGQQPSAPLTTSSSSSSSSPPASASASASASSGQQDTTQQQLEADPDARVHVYSREELLDTLRGMRGKFERKEEKPHLAEGRLVVGMVGYPNVGKSSTINVLLAQKKVSVSSTPGKTKNFQTHMLGDDIMLCDCPGLVFPTFQCSKADHVVNGIFPIDQLRNYMECVDLIALRIHRSQFLKAYALNFPEDVRVTGTLLVNAYARMRGFMKDKGRPDDGRAARILLKDFVHGKLLYCHPPPQLSPGRGRAEFAASFSLEGLDFSSEGQARPTDEDYEGYENVLINVHSDRKKQTTVRPETDNSYEIHLGMQKPLFGEGRFSQKQLKRQAAARRRKLKSAPRGKRKDVIAKMAADSLQGEGGIRSFVSRRPVPAVATFHNNR
jgi:large subunit GTPase 1